MWSTPKYEKLHFYPTIDRRRTATHPERIAFIRCFCITSLPDFDGICSRGTSLPIALQLGCDDQTVHNVLHGFNAQGLAVLHEGSARPHRLRTTFTEEGSQQLKEVLHRSPRDSGKERSTWTLELAVRVSFEQGLIPSKVFGLSLVAPVRCQASRRPLGTCALREDQWPIVDAAEVQRTS